MKNLIEKLLVVDGFAAIDDAPKDLPLNEETPAKQHSHFVGGQQASLRHDLLKG